ncbi:SRPBCC family protein [Microbispora sp. NEAU-D428]|uniref:SRPBCC family protein n=1 Tax=Microbispora sitophila TaxID=2771537 RepID=UPI0018683A3A|nr:SRPBCC family protein [Microbispora sitophila]MBE3010790.1 SRPBCC family protein [Microbispora sitophila]
MTEQTRERTQGTRAPDEGALPTQRLGQEFQNLATAVAERALSRVAEKIDGLAGRLTDYVEHGGSGLFSALTGKEGGGREALGGLLRGVTRGRDARGLLKSAADRLGATGGGGLLGALTSALTEDGGGGHPVRAALMAYGKEKIKGLFGGGGGGGKGRKGKKLKVTNIIESLDIGAPLRLVYNQWTQFEDFPSFMKKVETVEQKSDEKLGWKAQVFWSHRTWESTIVEQVPDSRIIWRSQGPKGFPDGSVTFHEITPELTRVLLVVEYHPQGFFERVGNLWRAQGRRVRLEFKHFKRHVMTNALLRPDEIEGWRGEIRDSEVVKDHETALREEREREGRERGEEAPEERAEAEEGEEFEEPEEFEEEVPEEGGAEEEPYEEEEEEPERARRPAYAGAQAGGRARPPVTRRRGDESAERGTRAPVRRREAEAERSEGEQPRRGEQGRRGEESEETGEAHARAREEQPVRRRPLVRRRRPPE